MAFLRRNKTGGTTRELEKALHAGLARYGDRRRELVPWILTGSPANPDLSQPDYSSTHPSTGTCSTGPVRSVSNLCGVERSP